VFLAFRFLVPNVLRDLRLVCLLGVCLHVSNARGILGLIKLVGAFVGARDTDRQHDQDGR
jgi:hypothetical protein